MKSNANTRRPALSAALLALMLGLGLAACQKAPDAPVEPTVGQKIDGAVANVERKAEEVKADVKEATAEARAETSQAADAAGTAVKDAAITAAVNAKLAADPALSALRINVDTAAGRVALSGDAPDATARDRATTLARSVDGVVDVNNQLTIQSKG
jgi:osmotically-inducible protein OsmY